LLFNSPNQNSSPTRGKLFDKIIKMYGMQKSCKMHSF
jgi:hypothetical protein